jgi:hypothetical protein
MPPDPNAVTLQGERLLLRRAREDDADALAAILSEPEVERWWGPYDAASALDELASSFVIVVDGAVAGWLLSKRRTGGSTATSASTSRWRRPCTGAATAARRCGWRSSTS